MKIHYNNQVRTIEAKTLQAALAELGLAGLSIAAAVNGEFVPKGQWGELRLSSGDCLEVLSPRQGG